MTKEYREMLIELYKENQKFLNKAIFSISVLAIPFLFKGLIELKLDIYTKYILLLSLFGFFAVIALQIFSLKTARDGCDEGLSKEKSNKSETLFNKARTLDKWREGMFLISLFLIIPAIVVGILNKENDMTNQVDKSKKKPLNESFVPPKAMNLDQKSYVPPKAVVSDNNGTGQSQTSNDSSNQDQNTQNTTEKK